MRARLFLVSKQQSMNLPAAIIVMLLLLMGPLAIRWIERHIEVYVLAIGILATALSGGPSVKLIRDALSEPILITIAVLIAALIFRESRSKLDEAFEWMRSRVRRPLLTGVSIFVLAMASSVITAIIAALVLVEIVGILHIHDDQRVRVIVAGCFAIGLGAALTPVGEPLSTLAASALHLSFIGLFEMLAPWVIPGVLATSILAGYFAIGEYFEAPAGPHMRETLADIIGQAVGVFGFVAGLVLISGAYAPIAREFVPRLSDAALYWLNTISAALDNATLVALEVHAMSIERARLVILALLISGGMLIPGNIPNVISAGALKIPSGKWARIAIPIGLVMLGIYFAVLKFVG
jgi:predicted cation transporter